MADEDKKPSNFIRDIIAEDLASGKHQATQTRFPPEPNGYLHIGHAKAITIDFGLAREFGGKVNLRFDDTNPVKEETEFVDAIKEDIAWLGWTWDRECYASDYFEQLFAWACDLIKRGLAYVDDQTGEEIRASRGNLTEAGKPSPYRDRSPEENLDLFQRMRAGEFPDGSRVLRAKIDMASPNMNLRDPVMYRIIRQHHHRTGDTWCIYPTYDYTHGQSDSLEEVTHSLCSLEFEDHRPLYNWFIEQLGIFPSRQIEFARLNLTRTIVTKRKLRQLIEENHVNGWDDPRMPTLRGMRRRGYTPESIKEFMARVGVTKYNSRTEFALLEHCLRQDLENRAPRRMAVLDPVKVTITNFPEGETEWYEGPNHPGDESFGTRKVPLTREIYIDRDDFMEDPPKKYFRLAPGQEVRLRYACYITCTKVIKDADGNIVELEAEFDPESRGGSTPDNRKVKGTIHWVSATENVPFECRLYDHLFLSDDPEDLEEGKTFLDNLNPDSLQVIQCYGEPELAKHGMGDIVQFERKGYYCVDLDSTPDKWVWNRTVSLKDSWSKKG
ncbi:MAG: glutamine--tRNA ligase/YqeY domain fusion protein [Verrucomicrobiota bacterium JB022]|nr:glutamine--tRNA ligase/YqeY domain fusion protein [Verrucomicrobiota bacterium JB022]